MRTLKLVPGETSIDFVGKRKIAFGFSVILLLLSIVFFFGQGLNFGIDFRGGILVEVKTDGPADIAELRAITSNLGIGEIQIQEFGTPDDILIRVQRQEGAEDKQLAAIDSLKQALGDRVSEYRRTEFVGPTIGAELIKAAILAVTLALGGILLYIWFRFEWQFGVGAVIALVHDVLTTIGLFALTQMEFNLTTIAAILTIAGYSINDTVVIYDRVREMLRKYKKLSMLELLNLSVNSTLSRTVMTSVTTLLAVVSLIVLGGSILRDFAIALAWGVVIGTYSSVFVAVPVLLFLKLRPEDVSLDGDAAAESDALSEEGQGA